MKLIQRIPILGRLIKEDKGQALVFTAVILSTWLGVTGIAVDAGKGYYAYELLQASTNAAVLAGAAGMPNTTTATTYADDYGSKTSMENANGILTNVKTNVSFGCSSKVSTDFFVDCEDAAGDTSTSSSPPSGIGGYNNTMQVNQTASVSTWIGPYFGVPNFSIQATSTAAMKGGAPTPYNIAIILDTTNSMTHADDGANSNCTTQIECAEAGIYTFLGLLVPGNSSTPIDQVTLYVFPGATTATMSKDYGCGGSSPTIVPYTFSSSTSGATTSALPSGDTYDVLQNLSSVWDIGYKTGSSVNTSDDLAKAVGWDEISGCGVGAPGGEGTYYAQVIYEAQAGLEAEHTVDGNANMMIILSDGDATACVPNLATSGGTSTTNDCTNGGSSAQITVASGGGTLNGTGTKTSNPMSPSGCSAGGTTACTGYLSYNYPSALGECGQAVQAAHYASSQGTTVYTMGYGTETSQSCTTDSTYSLTVSNGSYGAKSWAPGDQACSAIAAMATSAATFFSDNVNGCGAVDPGNTTFTSITSMFTKIAGGITSSRLIPNGNLNS
jgi:hypothetical protein